MFASRIRVILPDDTEDPVAVPYPGMSSVRCGYGLLHRCRSSKSQSFSTRARVVRARMSGRGWTKSVAGSGRSLVLKHHCHVDRREEYWPIWAMIGEAPEAEKRCSGRKMPSRKLLSPLTLRPTVTPRNPTFACACLVL